MAAVTLENLTKVYPNGTKALDQLNLHVAEGEFMVLVGPSGCGKTTALRMVAGLEDITSGTVSFGETVVNDLAPRQRDIAMVFQNYALYPHMTVAENIGFALRLARLPKADVAERVRKAASILGLERYLDSRPGQLSGGQRQRVAMGRAIVREPSVFLMDEPLSNLDAKLRVQMRAEVSRIQQQVGVATLYVTHDQVEAMTMGHRVAVLQGGTLQQCGPPQELYDCPANMFVAAFIGSPAMNLYHAQITPDGQALQLGSQSLGLNGSCHASSLASWRGKEVIVGARPEDLKVAPGNEHDQCLVGEVELVESLGSELVVHFDIDAKRAIPAGTESDDSTDGAASQRSASVARMEPYAPVRPGQQTQFCIDVNRLHLFDPASGDRLETRHPATDGRNGV